MDAPSLQIRWQLHSMENAQPHNITDGPRLDLGPNCLVSRGIAQMVISPHHNPSLATSSHHLHRIVQC
ncbi:hypothetical protein D3C85_1701290 [compost metagenome]